jgi:hypothetical protein
MGFLTCGFLGVACFTRAGLLALRALFAAIMRAVARFCAGVRVLARRGIEYPKRDGGQAYKNSVS